MKGPELGTYNPDVRLVEPDIERDPLIREQWLEGSAGTGLVQMMGLPDDLSQLTSLEVETQRVEELLAAENQLDWMIAYQGRIVGMARVLRQTTDYVPGPSLRILIGNPDVRRMGIGKCAVNTIVDYLVKEPHPYKEVYAARHLTVHTGPKVFLEKLGFTEFGPQYKDKRELWWQNYIRLIPSRQDDATTPYRGS